MDTRFEVGRVADCPNLSPGNEHSLHLSAQDLRRLLELQGPSLALWRGAEIAALREQQYERPVLDLGCGDGIVTSMVLSEVDFGVDPDPAALRQAAGRGIYGKLISARAEEMPIVAESIATVLSNSVVEHLTQLDSVLAAIARVLRPGGRFIFTTPALFFNRWLFLPNHAYAGWRNRQLAHFTIDSSEAWTQRLARVGLEGEYCRMYLRRELVWSWDVLELLQQLWIGQRRLFSLLWKRLPDRIVDELAELYAATDLSAAECSGGQLIVARKR